MSGDRLQGSWRDLPPEGKAALIRPLLAAGYSAGAIARQIDGASRNAVSGVIDRNPELRSIRPQESGAKRASRKIGDKPAHLFRSPKSPASAAGGRAAGARRRAALNKPTLAAVGVGRGEVLPGGETPALTLPHKERGDCAEIHRGEPREDKPDLTGECPAAPPPCMEPLGEPAGTAAGPAWGEGSGPGRTSQADVGIGFLDLGASTCRRPLWRDGPAPALGAMRFCGEATPEGRPYCRACAAMLWRPAAEGGARLERMAGRVG